MLACLYIKPVGDESTAEFAQRVATLLNLREPEERESSNWPPENCYYLIEGLGIRLKISASDESEYVGYRFYLSIDIERVGLDRGPWLCDLSELIAYKLTLGGHMAIRPLDCSSEFSDAVEYRNEKGSILTRTLESDAASSGSNAGQ